MTGGAVTGAAVGFATTPLMIEVSARSCEMARFKFIVLLTILLAFSIFQNEICKRMEKYSERNDRCSRDMILNLAFLSKFSRPNGR